MFFWIRELVGWLLVIVAMGLIWVGVDWVSQVESPRYVEAGMMMFAALGVLRLGVLLVRISTAARICLKEHPPRAE